MRTALIIAITLVSAHASAEPPAPPADLSQHKWRDRVLLLASNRPDEPELATMLERVAAHADGMRERDLVVYRLRNDDSLATQWRMSGAFTLVLVGKDGTEKLRTSSAIAIDKLFATIDAMPMRQREIGERATR